MVRALEVARGYAALSPAAFAQTKARLRQPASERLAQTGAAADAAVTEIRCAAEAQARIGDYVARTLRE